MTLESDRKGTAKGHHHRIRCHTYLIGIHFVGNTLGIDFLFEIVLEIEVVIRVRDPSATNQATGVSVHATLPAGIAYRTGTTSVNGILTSDDAVTTGSLALGNLGAGQEVVVRFRATVSASAFPIGTTQAVITASATADGILARTAQLTVNVTIQAAGTVQTGPGDAALVALMVSAIATLLYVSYTSSSTFRRHELERIGQERDPLDFK